MKFDRIQWLDQPVPTTRWQADIGIVTVENGGVKFDGKKHVTLSQIISVERVSSRSFAHDLVQVSYADGQALATVYFAVAYRRGGAQAIDQLFQMLENLSASQPPSSISQEAVETHREQVLANRTEINRRATRAMGIGVIIFLIGVFVTVGTYMTATSAGGVYVIAWGAIIGGIAMILRGFAIKQK